MIDFAFLDNRLEWTEILAGMDGEVKNQTTLNDHKVHLQLRCVLSK